MKSINKQNIVTLEVSKENLKNTKEFCSIYKDTTQNYDIVLNTSKEIFLDNYKNALDNIFSSLSTPDYSFVIVATPQQHDELSLSWNIVPTLQEAYDFIELERIERDLKFN